MSSLVLSWLRHHALAVSRRSPRVSASPCTRPLTAWQLTLPPHTGGLGSLAGTGVRPLNGDTVYVASGMEKVRYSGMDTPDVHRPTRGAEPRGNRGQPAPAR